MGANVLRAGRGRLHRLRGLLAAAACAVAAALGARAAEAGEPVKLLVELPSDVTQLTCGETVDLQIVGEDAQRARVGFGGRTVEVSATHGTVEQVRPPYSFRYRTPATLPDLTNVRIRAWLKEQPEVRGEVTVPVLPPAPFKRLVLAGPGSTPAGAVLEFTLKGETADGRPGDVDDATVNLRIERGRGTITLVRPGRYRLDTPADASGTVRVVASLKRYPDVAGSLDVLVTGGGGPSNPPPGGGNPPPGGGNPPPSGGNPPPSGGNPPPPSTPPGDEPEDPKDFVLWPSGQVRVEVWRTKENEGDKWSRDRNRVTPGGDFASSSPWQKIRIGVLRKDVKNVQVDEQLTVKGDWVSVPQSKDGRLVVVDRKDGTKAVHYEAMIPETGRRMTMRLTLRLQDGTRIEEVFVLRRVERAPEKK